MSWRGNFIDGAFMRPAAGETFCSVNPARPDEIVCEAVGDVAAVDAAVQAARKAAPGWRRMSVDDRRAALQAVVDANPTHADAIAEAISREMGKPIAEARIEANSVAGKIKGVYAQLPGELPTAHTGAPGEQRFHALGVIGVIGPFNFPVHLCNTHIIPALLTGNTVVVKPSDVTPLAGQRYAELMAALPPGVFNMVHGRGDVGAALAAHPGIDGLVFTGSYATGRRIRQATFDQPHKKISLELGGRNPAVVLDDADLDQVVREIALGALLTTGQRCTATSRVIATPGIYDALAERLAAVFAQVTPGDPLDADTFMGPLATVGQRDRFLALLDDAKGQGAEVLVESRGLPGGAFVTPSLYAVKGDEPYLREELFGPHVDLERAADDADALARAANNPYGLSASLFSARAAMAEAFYDTVRAGVININRSTNGASGLLPFGGTGMSGNWAPAGSCAPRLSTYPVALMQVPHGQITAHANLERQLAAKES